MSDESKSPDDSSLMKIVQGIAISPEDAREIVSSYQSQIKEASGFSDAEALDIVLEKIIDRYAMLSAASGGTTSLAGIIPGVGTAASMVGGSMADMSLCIKFQIDMTMCLAIAINNKLSNADAKHLSYIIGLAGTIEQATSKGAARVASKAGVRIVERYLTGAALLTIKELFKRVGILFTRTALVKAIPFGVGVVVGAGTNYALTRFVGNAAVKALRIHHENKSTASSL